VGHGAVTHLHDDALGELPRRVEASTGYQLGTDELTLFGLCPTCVSGTYAPSVDHE
jgi:Fe2+ or Zn2+ uptake regulation protein